MTTYLQESTEFQEVIVTLDGQPYTDFEVSIVPYGDRPGEWQTATELDGKHGFMVEEMNIGEYWVYVRIHDSPETPVIMAGTVTIR